MLNEIIWKILFTNVALDKCLKAFLNFLPKYTFPFEYSQLKKDKPQNRLRITILYIDFTKKLTLSMDKLFFYI